MGLYWWDSYHKDNKTQYKRNNTPWSDPRMKCSYIHSSFSKYKIFLLFFFLLSLLAPFFMGVFSLYSSSILHPSLPLVDLIGDLLDVCPIRNFLEDLWIAVNLDIIVQVSSPYKCGQVVWYRAFNVMVAAFSSNISSLIVGYFPWCLSLKEAIIFSEEA